MLGFEGRFGIVIVIVDGSWMIIIEGRRGEIGVVILGR